MAYYVSRGGLGVVPLSRMATGIGAFMWSDFRRNGLGLGGGLDPPSAECPQPVHTDERDALRNEIKGYTNPSQGIHEHENHPDVRAIYNDIVRRLQGLEERPKLLRCSNEARSRARNWIGQLEDLRRRVAKRGTTGPQGCQATSWVHVTEPIQFTVYRGPTYTIRPGSTRPDCFGAGGASATTPAGPTQSTAPQGSVVVNGVTYPSSAAAAAATSQPVETVGGGGAWEPSPGAAPAAGFLSGEIIPGVPNTYLVYGAGALLAWRMFKGK